VSRPAQNLWNETLSTWERSEEFIPQSWRLVPSAAFHRERYVACGRAENDRSPQLLGPGPARNAGLCPRQATLAMWFSFPKNGIAEAAAIVPLLADLIVRPALRINLHPGRDVGRQYVDHIDRSAVGQFAVTGVARRVHIAEALLGVPAPDSSMLQMPTSKMRWLHCKFVGGQSVLHHFFRQASGGDNNRGSRR